MNETGSPLDGNIPKHSEGNFGVLLESINHNVGLLAEGMTSLFQRQDRVEKKLENLESSNARIEAKVDALAHLQTLETRVDKLEEAVF